MPVLLSIPHLAHMLYSKLNKIHKLHLSLNLYPLWIRIQLDPDFLSCGIRIWILDQIKHFRRRFYAIFYSHLKVIKFVLETNTLTYKNFEVLLQLYYLYAFRTYHFLNWLFLKGRIRNELANRIRFQIQNLSLGSTTLFNISQICCRHQIRKEKGIVLTLL